MKVAHKIAFDAFWTVKWRNDTSAGYIFTKECDPKNLFKEVLPVVPSSRVF
jgi:hypothetical protein